MKYRTLMLGCLLAALHFPAYAVDSTQTTECNLSVGVVPQFEQRKLLATWTPILEKLSAQTGCHYEMVGAQNIAEFEKRFLAGVYDMAYMNPYHAVMAHQAQEYLPIVRSGAKKLQGILVVAKDSAIKDIKALHEKEIAFPSPNALGASLLMRAELIGKHGIDITPRYVKTHSSVYLHVAKKLTQAGGGVARTLKEQPEVINSKLRVLYKTAKVNAHPLVIHPRIDATLRKKIQVALLSISAQNPEYFSHIPMKSPIAASLEDYAELKALGLGDFVGQ